MEKKTSAAKDGAARAFGRQTSATINPSVRACPVLKLKSGYAAKFAAIRRHQQRASPARLCCNQNVERADRGAGPLQCRANLAGLLGVVDVERPHCDIERQKCCKRGAVLLNP